MSKSENSCSSENGAEPSVLPICTLDSSLVLLPGLVYSVAFTRFRAASLLERFSTQLKSIKIVDDLLSEFDFGGAKADTISDDAVSGIQNFCEAEKSQRLKLKDSADGTLRTPPEFTNAVICIEPNMSKITLESGANGTSEVYTVCRIVGIKSESSNIKIIFHALRRAFKSASVTTKRQNETAVTLAWNSESCDNQRHHRAIQTSCHLLFKQIDGFILQYREVLNSKTKKRDLLVLNPLANALYLQLASGGDFSRAYSSLCKIIDGWQMPDASDATNLLRVLDLIAAIVPLPNYKKLQVLNCHNVDNRATLVVNLLEKMREIFQNLADNNTLVNHWFYEEASGLQKASLVANQLKSIRIVLDGISSNSADTKAKSLGPGAPKRTSDERNTSSNGDDDDNEDDLQAITDFIKQKLPQITTISADSKRLLIKDYKRIKSSNPGNADFHVIRNYLDIVSDMPWEQFVSKYSSNGEIDLSLAKHLFNEDHYGLENVKTRLMQYLVVLKLLALKADKEYDRHGLEEAERERKLQNEKNSKKFTRESANGQPIIIPDNEEPRNGRGNANPKENTKVPENNGTSHTGLEVKAKAALASKNNKSPIIMLAGPPGVGKTSLAKSVARVLGRNFQRISLGGIKDESEIRGHRRTYVGAMPGTIVQALRKSQSMNPVILLDEIDKVVGGGLNVNKANGDPAAALLEVLDPEQNTQFIDHYIGFPIDLSQVIFICTANEPYNLSKPLLDRLEMINIGAYDYGEKLVIGSRYLLPRQIRRNGFPGDDQVTLDEDVMKKVIIDYTREAGVRNFERKLGTICRFKAVEYSDSLSNSGNPYDPKVSEFDLYRYLGVPHPNIGAELIELPVLASKFGVVNGLSYNLDGSGSVLVFECVGFDSEKNGPTLRMTGRLGDVLMESAKIGLTVIKNILRKRLLKLPDIDTLWEKFNASQIHLHVPSGAVLKDGPSAGITMALLFLSLLLEKPVPLNVAMTGEITLRGLVLPIGGLKEKILGAHLTGHVDTVIVPRDNRRDVIEEYVHKINDTLKLNKLLKDNAALYFTDTEPEDYFARKYGVQVLYAKEFGDVVKHVWGEQFLVHKEETPFSEYHL